MISFNWTEFVQENIWTSRIVLYTVHFFLQDPEHTSLKLNAITVFPWLIF